MTRRGRPPTGALLTTAGDVYPAIVDRLFRELPVTQADIAADCSTSRKTLARVVFRDTGLEWAEWISRILRPAAYVDGEDPGMKRVTVTLSDQTFTELRRRALDELRDPRLVARLLIERGVASRAPSVQPVRTSSRTAN